MEIRQVMEMESEHTRKISMESIIAYPVNCISINLLLNKKNKDFLKDRKSQVMFIVEYYQLNSSLFCNLMIMSVHYDQKNI